MATSEDETQGIENEEQIQLISYEYLQCQISFDRTSLMISKILLSISKSILSTGLYSNNPIPML